MDSSKLYIVDLKDPVDNHRRLLQFLCDAVTKYYNSRNGCRKGARRIPLKEYSLEESINTATTVNASLIVNALLYHVFSEAGLSKHMRDKHGRLYCSNVLSKLYGESWERAISKNREVAFRLVNNTCCTVLDMQDIDFAGFIERVVIPLYLNMCESADMPAYNPETRNYSQDMQSAILKWAASYMNATMHPGSEPAAWTIYAEMESVIAQLREARVPTEPEPAAVQADSEPSDVQEINEDTQEVAAADTEEGQAPSTAEAAAPEGPQQTLIAAEAATQEQLLRAAWNLLQLVPTAAAGSTDAKQVLLAPLLQEREAVQNQINVLQAQLGAINMRLNGMLSILRVAGIDIQQ